MTNLKTRLLEEFIKWLEKEERQDWEIERYVEDLLTSLPDPEELVREKGAEGGMGGGAIATKYIGEIKFSNPETTSREVVREIRKEFVKLAIKGKKDPASMKGLYLYTRTLDYLDTLLKSKKI